MIPGMFNIFLGMIFYTLQPYKQKWMNIFDGWVFTLAGILMVLGIINDKTVYILGVVAVLSTMIPLFTYAMCHKYKNMYAVNPASQRNY